MEIKHVSERAPIDGSIEDVYRRMMKKDFVWQQAATVTLAFLSHWKEFTTGPPIWAYEGHGSLCLTTVDKAGTLFVSVATYMREGVNVSYRLLDSENPLPWDTYRSYPGLSVPAAVIVVVHRLKEVLVAEGTPIELPEYVNVNPQMEATYFDSRTKCPHCETYFNLDDRNSWDGTMHIACKQNLSLRPY